MNYQRIYDSLIENRKKQIPKEGYCEVHHILPKSMGGTDDSDNLVTLTAKEHFICHLLLVKIHKDTPNYYKMVKAFFMMQTESKNQNRYITSRKYSKLREDYSRFQSKNIKGNKNPNYGKIWCVEETDINCSKRKPFPKNSIPNGWIPTKEMKKRLKDEYKKNKYLNKKNEMESKLTEWYNLYCSVGFDKFVEITGYQYSKPNLVTSFSRWVPTFIPQNGKKR